MRRPCASASWVAWCPIQPERPSDHRVTAVPRHPPDWWGAAQTLVEGCCTLPAAERVRWLEQLCLGLGDQLYPAFLRVLCLVGEHGEPLAQQAVAATLTQALASGRLPSGRQTAWGAAAGAATRQQGPIEFLCAWYLHPGSSDTLSANGFDQSARALLGLVAHDSQAHALYRARLSAAAADPLEGTWSRHDRAVLSALVQAWQAGVAPAVPVDAFLRAARQATPSGATGVASAWTGPGWAPGLR